MVKVLPVILAGGSGTRLWPLSRKSYPKQFVRFLGDKTLFQQSAMRLVSSESIEFLPHLVVTHSDFRFIVTEQLLEIGLEPKHILLEPYGRDTAPAIIAASIFSDSIYEDPVILAAPSDHVISDKTEFHKAINQGIAKLSSGKIVTFGIEPKYPETGFGYLNIIPDHIKSFGVSEVNAFYEKPNIGDAEKMFNSGKYLWNSGIFLFKARDMILAFAEHYPDTLELVTSAVQNSKLDLGFTHLDSNNWSNVEKISIDYAIMEKAKNLIAVPYHSSWSDLGDWSAVWSKSDKNEDGNVLSDGAHAINCSDTLIRTEDPNQIAVGLGLKDIIAVTSMDAVLIAHKTKAQELKNVVRILASEKIDQAENSSFEHRPWGRFEVILADEAFKIKKIYVKPGGILSLQTHRYRSEHWIVVQGTASIVINGEKNIIREGDSAFVPAGVTHQLANFSADSLIIIEIQTGSYLGEDDIIRHEDIYQRG
jgi:mannose-1-phosphate guanylyltransferase/mannose-6-phosphate isomerase